jgi:hypothetical protein
MVWKTGKDRRSEIEEQALRGKKEWRSKNEEVRMKK